MFKKLIKMLNNNRGEVLNEEVDRTELIIKQAEEEIQAEKEGRDPKDYLSKPQKKEDEENLEGEKTPDEQKIDKPEEEENQTEEEKAKLAEEAKSKLETETPSQEAGDAEVLEYAQKHKMTVAEAKEDIEKTNKIIEQFKNDPKEMARALRNKDREYDKLKNESEKKLKTQAPIVKRMSESQFISGAKENINKDEALREKLLDAYRNKYPAKSEMLSEDAIIEEILDIEWKGYNVHASQKETEMRALASEKRNSLIDQIPESYRKYIPEVKELLSHVQDSDVLGENFSVEPFINFAKGKHFEAEIKAAEERGYKRAKEGATILGVKEVGGGQRPSSSGKKSGEGLNRAQKERAIQMYGNNKEEDDCYRLFKETFEDELKENPSFL